MEIVIELDRKRPIKELNRWDFYAMYKRQSKKDKIIEQREIWKKIIKTTPPILRF